MEADALVDSLQQLPRKLAAELVERRDATVERVMAELAPYIDQRIQQLVPTQTGAVVPTTKAPQIDYRDNVPQR